MSAVLVVEVATLTGAALCSVCCLVCACVQNPDLPADVFTACLTTPIKVALRWFCSRSLLKHDGENMTVSLLDKPAQQQQGMFL